MWTFAFAGNRTKEIHGGRGEDVFASTIKSQNARVSAGVVHSCTSPLSSTDSRHHEEDHRHDDEAAVNTAIPMRYCRLSC